MIRPYKMSGLIWVQTVCHSGGIPARFIFERLIFFNLQTTKKHRKFPIMQKIMLKIKVHLLRDHLLRDHAVPGYLACYLFVCGLVLVRMPLTC